MTDAQTCGEIAPEQPEPHEEAVNLTVRARTSRAMKSLGRGGGDLARRATRAGSTLARDERTVAVAKKGLQYAVIGVAALAAHQASQRSGAETSPRVSTEREPQHEKPWLAALAASAAGPAPGTVSAQDDESWRVLPPSPEALNAALARTRAAQDAVIRNIRA